MYLRSAVRTLALLLIALAAFANCGHALAATKSGCLRQLIKVLYELTTEKRAAKQKEFARLYKNDPRFRAYLLGSEIELTDAEEAVWHYKDESKEVIDRAVAKASGDRPALEVDLRDIAADLSPADPVFQAEPRASIHPGMGTYLGAVLRLREGDTVVFGSAKAPKRFKLGAFLGSGNVTHIFALADHPDRVIRIPFGAAGYDMTRTIVFAQAYVSKAPASTKGRVQILEAGDGYIITERVFGRENAEEFLKRFLRQRGDRTKVEFSFDFKKYEMLTRGEPENNEKLRRLHAQPFWWSESSRPDQIVWDERRRDWILVDWE